MPPEISLIISVYGKADNLRLVLAACDRQRFRNFEVVIADDGSGPEVRDVVEEARQRHLYPIQHVWHADRGWRKNAILNSAVRAAGASHLAFIDGDCIPHREFLHDHLQARAAHVLVGGRRAEMSDRWSRRLCVEKISSGEFERMGAAEWLDGIRGRAVAVEAALRFEHPFLERLIHPKSRGLLGSNFSVARVDLEAINGFDELYDGPGCGEDSDIEFRLSLTGVRLVLLRHRAIQFHIYHPRTAISQACVARYREMMRLRRVRCEYGLDNPLRNGMEPVDAAATVERAA